MAGKTMSKYIVVTYNSLKVLGIKSVNGIGLDYPEFDLTAFESTIQEMLAGIPASKLTMQCHMDTTASGGGSAGSYTIFSDAAVLGNPTGAALTIDFGQQAAPATGNPRFSNTKMWCKIKITAGSPQDGPMMDVELVTAPTAVASWTTKP